MRHAFAAFLLLVSLPFVSLPAYAARSACLAGYNAATGAIDIDALDVGANRYVIKLPITGGGTTLVTSGGFNWSRESGTRIGYRDFAAAGVTLYSLNDPVAVIDKNAKLKVYVATATSASGSEAAGNTDWAIVSATWSE